MNQTFEPTADESFGRPDAQSTMICPAGLPNLDIDPRDVHGPESSFWNLSSAAYSTFGDMDNSESDEENALAMLEAMEESSDNFPAQTFNVSKQCDGAANKTFDTSRAAKNVVFHSIEERTAQNVIVTAKKRYIRSPNETELLQAIEQVFSGNCN